MIDLHAHILTDTDDGASSFEESVALLYEARKAGFTGIVCTPHYMQHMLLFSLHTLQLVLNRSDLRSGLLDLPVLFLLPLSFCRRSCRKKNPCKQSGAAENQYQNQRPLIQRRMYQ